MIEVLKNKGWYFGTNEISLEKIQDEITSFTNFDYFLKTNILTPNKISSAKLSLSKIYGFNSYPFHTDGVQYEIPPRFLLLINKTIGHNETKTLLKDGFSLAESNKSLFFNSIFKIRGNGFKELSPIINKRKVKEHSILRYNPVIMDSIIKKKKIEINKVIKGTKEIEITWLPKSYLVIDNWRMLHSRTEITKSENLRAIERTEFYIKNI